VIQQERAGIFKWMKMVNNKLERLRTESVNRRENHVSLHKMWQLTGKNQAPQRF
jgi:hypothetical protein